MINLTQEQIDMIKKLENYYDYCDTQENCWSCPLYKTNCEEVFIEIKKGNLKVKKPYTPTRLDYFVARIASGYMANENMTMDIDQMVKIAKSLIKEIDKQEGAS